MSPKSIIKHLAPLFRALTKMILLLKELPNDFPYKQQTDEVVEKSEEVSDYLVRIINTERLQQYKEKKLDKADKPQRQPGRPKGEILNPRIDRDVIKALIRSMMDKMYNEDSNVIFLDEKYPIKTQDFFACLLDIFHYYGITLSFPDIKQFYILIRESVKDAPYLDRFTMAENTLRSSLDSWEVLVNNPLKKKKYYIEDMDIDKAISRYAREGIRWWKDAYKAVLVKLKEYDEFNEMIKDFEERENEEETQNEESVTALQ